MHCTHSFVIFLCTPTVCYSVHVYSEQRLSTVFPSAVLTHCDGLLPVASYPVLQTQTSLQLIGEFIVYSRRGQVVPLFFFSYLLPSLTVFLSHTHKHAHTVFLGMVLVFLSW